jgi:hypothetical protein
MSSELESNRDTVVNFELLEPMADSDGVGPYATETESPSSTT